jgi:UDP-4-amino-4-deoxy-L-arabinose-oxoglutarate aminotransferase
MVTADTIRVLITERTRLIVPVHYAGAAVELDAIRAVANEYDIPLIEDAAHAIGTEYKGRTIGQDGHTIFSFHPIKNITTGEGGMFCTDDSGLADRIRRLKFHGLGVDAYDREIQGRSPQAEVLEPGFKYNLPDMNAVLGISQLNRLSEINNRREELAKIYQQQLADIDEIMPLTVPETTTRHAWHLFIIRLDLESAGMTRDQFMSELKSLGIGTGLHFKAVHSQKYYRENTSKQYALANTDWNSERICSLPLFPDMRDEDIFRVVNAINTVLRSA